MGRKPKNNATVLSPENAHPSQEIMQQQASSGDIKSPRVLDSQPGSPHPMVSPVMHLNLSPNGVGTSHERNTPQGKMNQEIKPKKKYATFTKTTSKHQSASVRRSDRIKSGVVHCANSNQGIVCIDDITISDSDKDEPGTLIEPVLQDPQSHPELEPVPADNLSGKSLDEKVDYALQKIEALGVNMVLLNSKVDGNVGLYEVPSVAPISYRSMYIDSQKKLQALTIENRQLTRELEHALGKTEILEAVTNENRQLTEKLENALGKIEMLEALAHENRQLTGKLESALGKIEMYEKQNRDLSEPLDKLKDTANAAASVLSNLARTAEAVVHASTPAIDKARSASKRKRNES